MSDFCDLKGCVATRPHESYDHVVPRVDSPHLEAVNHPSHYGGEDNLYEAIKVIEAAGWGEGFVKGNALKYLMRAGSKPGEPEDKDMEKVIWYAERRVKQIRGEV